MKKNRKLQERLAQLKALQEGQQNMRRREFQWKQQLAKTLEGKQCDTQAR